MTAALRAGRCAADDPLEDTARHAARRVAGVPRHARAFSDTTRRTSDTAAALGLSPTPDPALADLDLGGWTGRDLMDLPVGQVAAWTADPSATPHGGESVLDLLERVGGWLRRVAALPGRTVAITHPAVVRAVVVVALDANPESFWRIDVPPLTSTGLHAHGGRWALRHACLPL